MKMFISMSGQTWCGIANFNYYYLFNNRSLWPWESIIRPETLHSKKSIIQSQMRMLVRPSTWYFNHILLQHLFLDWVFPDTSAWLGLKNSRQMSMIANGEIGWYELGVTCGFWKVDNFNLASLRRMSFYFWFLYVTKNKWKSIHGCHKTHGIHLKC